ncbi:nucleotidyltransferase family protein, partial [Desulfovibrio sp. OttesenSCG-928-C14]|nr:nucleotidyltransferase family protein [Desulfovibrio sp. OttesenSCG-928-C14]
MSAQFKVSAIILAAGLSRRMGRNKLLLPVAGRPMLAHCLDLVLSMGFYQNILVTTSANIAGLDPQPGPSSGLELVLNPSPEKGQSFTLRRGLERANGEAYLFLTGDQPFLDADTLGRILAAYRPGHIVIPRHSWAGGAKTGSPVLFPADLRANLAALEGDFGGRGLFKDFPEKIIYAELPGPGPLL